MCALICLRMPQKEWFCLVRFEDDGVVRIAPLEFVRWKSDKSPFAPQSANDLPKDPVEVKWDRSLSGSFSHDGYYTAKVLAIGGEYNMYSIFTVFL